MNLFRGIADDLRLDVWLEQHIWPREGRFVDEAFVYDGARLAAAEMLRGGVTCCNDMYFFPEAGARAFLELGLRAMLGMPILDFPPPTRPTRTATSCAALRPATRSSTSPRSRSRWRPTRRTRSVTRRGRRSSSTRGSSTSPCKRTSQKRRREVTGSENEHGRSPLARLHELGVTGPQFMAIHGVHLGASDIALLAAQGCHVVHCPVSNMKLGCGIAPVAALVEQGVNVALGTDGAASNNRIDLFGEMRVAALLAKAATGDPSVFPAQQALSAATLSGARALGLDSEIGSLVPGKQADIIAVDLSGSNAEPCYDPVSHLVHAVGREAVTDVWVGGRRIVENRVLQTADEAAIGAAARLWQERLK
jgi:5-methylthioadenosine/S-adenosylhomocysteine deaminase